MIVALGLFAAYAAIVLVHARPPSLTDLGDWTYEGVLFGEHLRGVADPAHHLKVYPVPNSTITVAIGLLSFAVPWVWAAKIWLLVYFALAIVTVASLLRARDGGEWLWLIAPPTLFLSVNFWYGFLNFQCGVCLAILLAAMVLREEPRAWRFGAALLLGFFTHMIPFAFAATVLFFYALRSGRTRLLWQFVPVTLATAVYFYGRFFLDRDIDASVRMGSPVRDFRGAFWAYKVNSLLKSGGLVNPGSPHGSTALAFFGKPVFSLLLLSDVLLCACIVWMIFAQLRTGLRGGGPEAAIWGAVLLFVPVYLVLPGEALGVSDPGSRVLQTILAVALLLCSGQRRMLRFSAVPAVILGGAGLVLFATVGYRPFAEASGTLPLKLVTLGHVPDHDQDGYYKALSAGEMDFRVFPTGMFTDTPLVRNTLPR